MILDDIVEYKKQEVILQKQSISEYILDEQLEIFENKKTDRFSQRVKRLKNENIKVIAEIKKASPSKGIIRKDFDPLKIASVYASLNVDAISVLTEKKYFMGSIQYLKEISSWYNIPLLRKDFIIDIYQIKEAILNGASAVLLIAAILDNKTIKNYIDFCTQKGIDYILEVHNEKELSNALDCGAEIIGINNRNLKTFEVDIKTTERLIRKISDDRIIIAESGIQTHSDIAYINGLKIDAVLIGEALMKKDNIAEEFAKMFGNLRNYDTH